MANMLYESNQYYVDNDLENALLNIQKQLQKKCDFEEIKDVNTKTVLFYDGFGLDSRGLAYISKGISEFGLQGNIYDYLKCTRQYSKNY